MLAPTYDRVLREAAKLSRKERLLLIEHLVARLRAEDTGAATKPRWEDFAGGAPSPLCGEDAQEWVSRTRRESDEGRGVR